MDPVLFHPSVTLFSLGQSVTSQSEVSQSRSQRVGWKFTGTEREKAQQAWADLINAMGGDAKIISGVIK